VNPCRERHGFIEYLAIIHRANPADSSFRGCVFLVEVQAAIPEPETIAPALYMFDARIAYPNGGQSGVWRSSRSGSDTTISGSPLPYPRRIRPGCLTYLTPNKLITSDELGQTRAARSWRCPIEPCAGCPRAAVSTERMLRRSGS